MKITFLVSCLTHGGAEKVASLWINGFVDRGYDVSCIVMVPTAPISYIIPDCVKIYKVNVNGVGLIHNWKQITKIRYYLKVNKSEVLITVLHPLSLMGYIASLGLNIKVINTEHNTFARPSYMPFTLLEKFYKFYVNRLFDKVTVFTNADIKYIGNRLNNIVYLPNPLSLEPVEVLPRKDNIILAVGRMEAWHVKGFDLLIDAWGELSSLYPDWKLQILGGGSEECREFLKRRAYNTNVCDSIEFVEFTPNPIKLFQRASIFILSSRYEGFGMVLLEAMSQGCACIACDYKSRQSEILNSSKMGICTKTDSKEAIKNAINRMISDENYRESTRRPAINRSIDYKLERIMDIWENILNELC